MRNPANVKYDLGPRPKLFAGFLGRGSFFAAPQDMLRLSGRGLVRLANGHANDFGCQSIMAGKTMKSEKGKNVASQYWVRYLNW